MWTLIVVMCAYGEGAYRWTNPHCVSIVTDFQTEELCEKAVDKLIFKAFTLRGPYNITCVQKSS